MNFHKKFVLILIAIIAVIMPHAVAQPIQANVGVQISIQGVPQEDSQAVSGNYRVSGSGTIRMPYLNELRAAGLRPEQLAANIEAAYRNAKIFTRPTVQVVTSTSDTLVEQTVNVGGFVRRPGHIPYTNNLTLYAAVQQAGGVTEFGSQYRVALFRNGGHQTIDLSRRENWGIPVRANDIIDIPQKNWRGR